MCPRSLPMFGLLPLIVMGCSPEDTPPLAFKKGQFIDSPVEGLLYSGGRYTEANGVYRYNPDSTMQFFLGDIAIGTLWTPRSLFAGRLVTPVQLVEGALDQNNQEVVNIARFLLTLDFDEDSANGIEILRALHEIAIEEELELDFALDGFDFQQAAQIVLDAFAPTLGGTRVLVDTATASTHLQATLLASFAGEYTGEYFVPGTEENEVIGELQLFFNRAGEICGFTREAGESEEAAVGTLQSNGTGSFTVPTTAGNFSLTFAEDKLGGSWIDSENGPGMLEATRGELVDFFLGPEVLDFVGTYVGTIGPGEEIVILVDTRGDLALDDPLLCGTILEIDDGVASFRALSTAGDVLSGTIEDGRMNGKSTSSEGSFSFTLRRP